MNSGMHDNPLPPTHSIEIDKGMTNGPSLKSLHGYYGTQKRYLFTYFFASHYLPKTC